MSIPNIEKLLDRYLTGECTAAEQLQVEQWLESQDVSANEWTTMEASAKEDWIASLYNDIQKTIRAAKEKNARVVPIYRRPFLRVAIAASVITMLAAASYFIFFHNQPKTIVKTNDTPGHFQNDILPGSNRAVLTLADNSTIVLNDAENGTLTTQGNTRVLKLNNGQIAYNGTDTKSTEILYNTVSTPRGGQYQLTLSDGTKVWLNAATSIRFPASFVGTERKVEINGEAYFEVAKNAAMPFKVNVAGKGEVEVLGTHFNINSYSDEPTINTTLLEGSVKVTGLKTNNTLILSPGQQGVINSEGRTGLNTKPDIESVMAWKNEKFIFQNADLKFVMRQLERWYDVDVVYDGNVPDEKFVGIISRNVNVSQILKMLETAGTVKFEISGKKIIVK